MSKSPVSIETAFGLSSYIQKPSTSSTSLNFVGVLKARFSDFLVHECSKGNASTTADEIAILVDNLEDSMSKIKAEDDVVIKEREEAKEQAVKKAKLSETASSTPNPSTPTPIPTIDSSPSDDEYTLSVKKCTSKLFEIIGQSELDSLTAFLVLYNPANSSALVTTNPPPPQSYSLPKFSDKSVRGVIHNIIKSENFRDLAVADTHEQCIRIWPFSLRTSVPNYKAYTPSQNNSNGSQPRGKNSNKRKKRELADRPWPKTRGSFLRFVVYMENCETMSAVKDLQMKLNTKSLAYAGTKDKRGVTTQFMTVPLMYPQQLDDLVNKGDRRGGGGGRTSGGGKHVIKVGSYKYVDDALTLGDLAGNRFDVVLRNCDLHKEEGKEENGEVDVGDISKAIEANCERVRSTGFVNYYGMQRFGKFFDTHEVGVKILRNDFEGATDVIMREKIGGDEHDDISLARRNWANRANGDVDAEPDADQTRKLAKQTSEKFNRWMMSEKTILDSISRSTGDRISYKRAFDSIPKNMKLMFMHAVQSLVWNKATSYRLDKYGGEKVVVGDLIAEVDADGNGYGNGNGNGKGNGKGKQRDSMQIHCVTEEDVKSGRFDISDVVLPLPGHSVVLPTNSCNQHYGAILRELKLLDEDDDGGEGDMDVVAEMKKIFTNKDNGQYSLGGDYRKIVVKPADFVSKIVMYGEVTEPLIETDLMKIQGAKCEAGDGDSKRDKVGLVVGFSLPSSSYATMMVRELTRRPTLAAYQNSLRLEGRCESVCCVIGEEEGK